LQTPRLWREASARRKRFYAWIGLSIVMVLVVLVTSLGARPGPLQLLFLAAVGMLMAGVTVLLVDSESGSGRGSEGD